MDNGRARASRSRGAAGQRRSWAAATAARPDARIEVDARFLDDLVRRQKLLEKLALIQRSISHRAPLQEVLDAITAGAAQLLGDEVVGLRLIDEHDPSYCVLASAHGVPAQILPSLRRTPVGAGAGGLAVRENRLVVVDRYAEEPGAFQVLVERGLQAAVAAPVHERDQVVGSLVVASYRPGRTYDECEQELLTAFAQHAGLALSDARTVDAMRQARYSLEMFLAMVSHELKTPLTGIMGMLRTLQRHRDALGPEQLDELLALCSDKAEDLRTLINRILEGARAELAATREDIFLSDLVAGAIGGFARARELSVGAMPEVLVRVDTRAVAEVVGILLENAVAHSPAESRIEVEARIEGDDALLSVRNPGSLPDGVDSDALFAPFQRGQGASSAGVGLGLYIASRVANSIGGTLRARSLGGVVEFTLRFPVDAPDEGLEASSS